MMERFIFAKNHTYLQGQIGLFLKSEALSSFPFPPSSFSLSFFILFSCRAQGPKGFRAAKNNSFVSFPPLSPQKSLIAYRVRGWVRFELSGRRAQIEKEKGGIGTGVTLRQSSLRKANDLHFCVVRCFHHKNSKAFAFRSRSTKFSCQFAGATPSEPLGEARDSI